LRKTALSLLVLACVAPLVHADPALGYDGSIAPTATGYVVTQADQLFLSLTAGDVVRATLQWADPGADLDLRLTSPGGACEVYPSPDALCVVNGRVPDSAPACPYDASAPLVAGQTSESFARTAPRTGTYEVDVEAAWVDPATTRAVAYHLEAFVDGAQVDLHDAMPTSVNVVHSTDLICHAKLP
jgi:hypothetical protein